VFPSLSLSLSVSRMLSSLSSSFRSINWLVGSAVET